MICRCCPCSVSISHLFVNTLHLLFPSVTSLQTLFRGLYSLVFWSRTWSFICLTRLWARHSVEFRDDNLFGRGPDLQQTGTLVRDGEINEETGARCFRTIEESCFSPGTFREGFEPHPAGHPGFFFYRERNKKRYRWILTEAIPFASCGKTAHLVDLGIDTQCGASYPGVNGDREPTKDVEAPGDQQQWGSRSSPWTKGAKGENRLAEAGSVWLRPLGSRSPEAVWVGCPGGLVGRAQGNAEKGQ